MSEYILTETQVDEIYDSVFNLHDRIGTVVIDNRLFIRKDVMLALLNKTKSQAYRIKELEKNGAATH